MQPASVLLKFPKLSPSQAIPEEVLKKQNLSEKYALSDVDAKKAAEILWTDFKKLTWNVGQAVVGMQIANAALHINSIFYPIRERLRGDEALQRRAFNRISIHFRVCACQAQDSVERDDNRLAYVAQTLNFVIQKDIPLDLAQKALPFQKEEGKVSNDKAHAAFDPKSTVVLIIDNFDEDVSSEGSAVEKMEVGQQ